MICLPASLASLSGAISMAHWQPHLSGRRCFGLALRAATMPMSIAGSFVSWRRHPPPLSPDIDSVWGQNSQEPHSTWHNWLLRINSTEAIILYWLPISPKVAIFIKEGGVATRLGRSSLTSYRSDLSHEIILETLLSQNGTITFVNTYSL
jgi:hypothetical protein